MTSADLLLVPLSVGGLKRLFTYENGGEGS